MSVSCPYCGAVIKLKSVRAGRFQPKCARCGQVFVLTVSDDAEPKLTTSAVPGVAVVSVPDATVVEKPPPRAVDVYATVSPPLEVTAVPGQVLDDAGFSVASAVVVSDSSNPDATTAVDATALPPAPGKSNAGAFDATEADASDAGTPQPEAGEGKIPTQLGNYQVIKELGRGGMGAVYLARQVSLDRPVALKVMNSQWASNPAFLVRFTREAYAAAQLVHHNVVQVYDIGADKGVNYFSMEFVEGRSLGDLIKKEGKIPAEAAAGYVLQAARGLKFAHERGMIHRDIKPDNLMLNNQGVVKVADLGLVRTPGMEEVPAGDAPAATPGVAKSGRTLASLSNVTQAGQAMGTPSYMAPEQARDATRIDHRADIYSLGCTLYVMVTGRPVFQGSNALEVMTKHASEPLVRPDVVFKEVPRGLSDIVVKMLAKKPEDRYASMDDVIKAMEDFLGLQGAGKLAQTEQHIRTLERGVKAFHSASGAGLRAYILLGFFGGCVALAVLLLLFGAWRIAGATLGLGLMTALAYFVVSGLSQKGPLFLKARDLLLSSSGADWLKFAGGLVLFVGVLWLLGLHWAWLLAALLAVGLALGMHFALDRHVAAGQAQATEAVESLLKTLRGRGLSEEALQEFVARNAGDGWEQFFEALFGYEAKLAARAQYGRGPKGQRPKFAGWRDPIIHWIDAFARARQEARERRHLQAIEQANLVAQGVSAAQARQQAEAVAQALVVAAADIRQQPAAAPAPPPAPVMATAVQNEVTAPETTVLSQQPAPAPRIPPRRVNVQEMIALAEKPQQTPARSSRALSNFFGTLFGGGVRFLLGGALLLIALFWLNAQGLLPGASNLEQGWRWWHLWTEAPKRDPLAVPLVPTVVLKALCSIGAAVAGAILILSAIWRSWKIGLAVLLAAAVMVIGPVSGYVPSLGGPLTAELLCLVAGGALAVLGFLFGRDT